jgi:hypothetical protein
MTITIEGPACRSVFDAGLRSLTMSRHRALTRHTKSSPRRVTRHR